MFYDQLKKLCDEKGVKITPLVKSLGMSTGNLKRWQEGISPTKETLIKFAEYFNVSTDYLLLGTEIKQSKINIDDKEWLDLIHRLPEIKRLEYKAEIRGYLKHLEESSVAADEYQENKLGKSLA